MAVRLVIGVGIAKVERQVIFRIRVHLPRRNHIEPLRRLPVAFPLLRPQFARPFADGIGAEKRIGSPGIFQPGLHDVFLLENPHEKPRPNAQAELRQIALRVVGDRLQRPRREAARKHERRAQRRRGEKPSARYHPSSVRHFRGSVTLAPHG